MAFQIRDESSGEEGKLSRWAGISYSLNSIMGAGFLSLPWAYSRSGWLFGTCFTVFAAFQCCVISFQLLDVMSRVEILMRLKEAGYSFPRFRLRELIRPSRRELLLPRSVGHPIITSRRVDMVECVRHLFGNVAGMIFIALLLILLEGSMTAYASLFAASFVSTVPLGPLSTCNLYEHSSFNSDCRWKYWIWLLLYGLIVVHFTVKGLKEQRWFQSLMTLLRILIIGTLLICCTLSLASQRNLDNDNQHSVTLPPLVNFSYMGKVIPLVVFALFFQQVIPTIAAHVKKKQENLRMIITSAISLCTVCYILVGIIVPLTVDDVPSLGTLIFTDYSGGHSQADRPWWSNFVEYIIILTPGLDVISSFPLMALSLSDNLISLVYGSDRTLPSPRARIYFIRIASCLPPLLVAMFAYNLGTILDWIGLILLVLVPIAVPLMQVAAKNLIHSESPYDTRFSHPVCTRQVYCYAIVIVNTAFLIIAAVENGISEGEESNTP